MSRISSTVTNNVSCRVGVGGNLYLYSLDKAKLVLVCDMIGKSPRAIYHSKKHNCWTLRIKHNRHKDKIYELQDLADTRSTPRGEEM